MLNFKSYFFQILGIIVSFLNIKLMLEFLGNDQYSTWLIIFSVASVVYGLDIGTGSRVRNEIARLLAKNISPNLCAKVVIEYYKLIFTIAAFLAILATIIGIVSHTIGLIEEIGIVTISGLTILIFADFVSRAHHPIFAGLQRPELTNFALTSLNIITCFVLYYFLVPNSDTIIHKIMILSMFIFGISIIINIIMIIKLNTIVPIFYELINNSKINYNKKKLMKNLKSGFPFFLLQIEFTLLTQITLYFIYAYFTHELVVEIAIADKVFSPFLLIATVIMYPFWSTYTLLVNKGESEKALNFIKMQEYFALLFFPIFFLSLFIYPYIVKIWLDRDVNNYLYAFFSIIKIYAIFLNSIYSYFMNGIGNLRPQIYVYSIGLILSLILIFTGSIYQNIYICLTAIPMVFFVSAFTQRYHIFSGKINVTASPGSRERLK